MKAKKDQSVPAKSLNKKKKALHLPEVDLLKATAALLVVLIHVTSRYRNDSDLMFYFWDYIHFAVASFVLASGYLFQNKPPIINNFKDYALFLWKKFKRIVIPYYIFAIIFSFSVAIFGNKELTDILNIDYIFKTVFLWGGTGNNWIPLLFMGIMFVEGLQSWISPRFPQFKYFLFTFSLSVSIYQMTRDLDFLSKFDKLFGWLVIFYIGRFLYGRMELLRIVKLWVISLVLFIVLNYLFGVMGLEQSIFSNKYPPNFYFITYQLTMILPLFYVMYRYGPLLVDRKRLWLVIAFISASSYEIFFYHLLIMEFWKKEINWLVDWVLITTVTAGMLYLYRYLEKNYFKKPPK